MSINAGTVVGYLDLDASKFKSALKDAQSSLSDFTNKSNSTGTRFEALGSTLKTVGSNMSKYVTLPLAGLGTASVATAATFEKSMSQVAATMGMTAEEINNGSESYKKLEQAALDMGATTQFSASEASEALNYLALAGYDVDKSVSTLPTVLNLAAAGGLELGYASDVMTDAMSALGLETSQAEGFVDQLAKTSQKSNTSVGQLGEAILTVGGTAKVLAGGTTEMNTALGILADNGIKGAEGGTALRNVILSLSAPTDKAAKTMKELGLEVFDAHGNMRPLNEIFKDLDGTLSTMTQGEQTKVLSELFNKVDLKSVNALLANSGERFNELSGYIADSDGAAAAMADTMNNNLSGQLTLLKSGLEGAAISIGNALLPVIKVLVEWINNLVTWFNNLNPGIQTAITIFGLVVAAIGPVLLIVGHLCTAIGSLITFFGAGGAGAGVLSAAIGALSGPVGIAIAAITALIAIGVLLYQNWDTVKAKCIEIWEGSIKPVIQNVTNTVSNVIKTVWNAISSFLSGCWNGLTSICKTVWNAISNTVSTVTNTIRSTIQTVFSAISSIISTITNTWKSIISSIWNGIKSVFSNATSNISSNIQTTFSAISSIISTISGIWVSNVQARLNEMKSIVTFGVNAVKTVISTVFSALTNIMTAPFKTAQSVISGILGGITSAINKVTSAIKKVTSMGKMIEKPYINNEQGAIDTHNESDYAKVKFNYTRAKQTTISDVMATNYSMLEGLKDFAKDLKVDSKQANVKTDNNVNINLNIDKFINETSQSIDDLMNEIAFKLKRKALF